jgi:hypothetical protein
MGTTRNKPHLHVAEPDGVAPVQNQLAVSKHHPFDEVKRNLMYQVLGISTVTGTETQSWGTTSIKRGHNPAHARR